MRGSEDESKIKKLMKRGLFLKLGLAGGAFSSFFIIGLIVIIIAAIVFISPVMQFTSFVERLKNTFTEYCFFCDYDDVSKAAQEKFYKKVQKIDDKYKKGVDMDDTSIQLDISLLISSALMDRMMTGNIGDINASEDYSDEQLQVDIDNYNQIGRENAGEEGKVWTDAASGDGITSLWKTSWYEAEGDPIKINFYGCGDGQEECYVESVEFSTKKEPAGASALRKLAKHMVKKEAHWYIHRNICSDEEGNTWTCWDYSGWFEYVLSVDKDDSAYTVSVDEEPYVAVIKRPTSEEQVNGKTSSFVKYLLSTYIPENFSYSEQGNNSEGNDTYHVLPDPSKVSKQEYLDAKKSIKNNMYYYKFIYDEIAKYISIQNQSLCSYGGSCEYTVGDETYSNVKVRLLQCKDENEFEPIEGGNLVDFEKYILGVVYAEIGDGAPSEAAKAQAVAARSYAINRKTGNSGMVNEGGQWILEIRNCTYDQVYCDPDKGCSKATQRGESTMHSGTDSMAIKYKGPLSTNSELRQAVLDTTGEVLMEGNKIYASGYTSTEQNTFKSLANQGFEYNQILASVYGTGLDIKSSCDASCGVTGDFATWKQTDAAWGDVIIGSPGGPMKKIGCLVTSLSIQIARSGATPFDNFNPGSFAIALNQIGAFSSNGSLYSDMVTYVAPDFYRAYSSGDTGGFVNASQAEKASIIQKQLADGCYPIVRVKGDGHFVAVDRVEGDNVYIFDPDPANKSGMLWPHYSSSGTTLSTCWKKR